MNDKKNSFTSDQIDNFTAYHKVQMSGRYNMFDNRARLATGMTKEEYMFVMSNYEELAKAAEVEIWKRSLTLLS